MGLGRPTGPSMAGRLFATAPGGPLALLRAAWPQVVGREISRRSEVVSLDRRTLNVRVVDLGWQRVLHRMRREILGRLASMAGELAPARLGFTVGPVVASEEPPPAPSVLSGSRAPGGVEAAAAAIEDLELRERFLRSAALYLERKHHA